MAGQTKVNQDGRDHGVQYSVANLKCMELDAGATLAAKDGVDGSANYGTRIPSFYNPQEQLVKSMVVDGLAVTAVAMQTFTKQWVQLMVSQVR